MRTSADIYYQLTWDNRFEPRQYLLGIQTRLGIREVAVVDFDPHGDIPWHRILYVRGPQGLVWDRAQRLDVLTPPAHTPIAHLQPEEMLVASLNCCSGRHGVGDPQRMKSLVAWLMEQNADLIALQEVGPQLRQLLPSGWHIFCHGELALLSRRPPLHQRTLSLPFAKSALLAQWPGFHMAVVHFSSNYRGAAAPKRLAQWKALLPDLGERWIVAGDFNADDTEVRSWPAVNGYDEGPCSFDPDHNPLAAQTSRSGRSLRLDRVLTSTGWAVQDKGTESHLRLSDHYPIWTRLAPAQAPPVCSHQSALAVLPYCPPAQQLRSTFDPAYGRWPAHVNLLFPAPLELPQEALAQALREIPAGKLCLNRLGVFEHSNHATVYWQPDHDSRTLLGDLRQCLLKILDRPQDTNYEPHLTLAKLPKGQVTPKLLREWSRQLGTWQTSLHWLGWLRRGPEEPFRLHREFELASPWRQHRAFQRVEQACQSARPGGRLEVVGSSLWLKGRDLDLVYPGDGHVLDQIARQLPRARRHGELVRWEMEGLSIDLSGNLEALADARALTSYVRHHQGEDAFARHYERVIEWAETRRLIGQAYGLPGGLAWAVLAALWDGDDFWRRGAHWDWSRPLGLTPSLAALDGVMKVLAPALPVRNLTRWVSPTNLAILQHEWSQPNFQPATPSAPYLRLPLKPGQQLEIMVSIEKRWGRAVRPWPARSGESEWCLSLWPEASQEVMAAIRHMAQPQG